MSKKDNIHSPTQVCIVPAGLEHLAAIVACHKAALREELPTLLGPRFLRGMYRFFIGHVEGICLIATKYGTNCVRGVLIGGNPQLRKRYLLRNLNFIIMTLFYRGICDSRVRKRLMQISYAYLQKVGFATHAISRKKSKQSPPDKPQGKWYLIQEIAVHPDFQRQGVGSALLKRFQLEAAQRECLMMRLTAATWNIAAINLYKKLGWKDVGTDGILIYFHRSIECCI